MTTFHPFPRLPQEIRDLIWEKAARVQAEKIGVHFFTIFNSTNKEESAAVVQQYKLRGPSRSCLAAPRCKDGQGFSWTEGNSSMYLLDRGLWKACRDSRAAIVEVSTMTMGSESCISDDTPDMAKLYDEPRTAKFMLEGHEQEMMVWPERDLFCLQPYDWNMAKIWLQHTAISSQHGKFCFRHVAFELPRDEIINLSVENEYNRDAPEPSSHLMLERIESLLGRGRFHHVEKVWLIDYQLKRVNPRPNTAQQFFANGFRLVEVTEQDDDEWTDRRGDGRDALEFAGWLRYSTNYQNENTSPEIGVLACEEC